MGIILLLSLPTMVCLVVMFCVILDDLGVGGDPGDAEPQALATIGVMLVLGFILYPLMDLCKQRGWMEFVKEEQVKSITLTPSLTLSLTEPFSQAKTLDENLLQRLNLTPAWGASANLPAEREVNWDGEATMHGGDGHIPFLNSSSAVSPRMASSSTSGTLH